MMLYLYLVITVIKRFTGAFAHVSVVLGPHEYCERNPSKHSPKQPPKHSPRTPPVHCNDGVLLPLQVQIDDQTSIHCWVSKPFAKNQEPLKIPRRTSLLLLHGFGASAIWQWAGQINAFHKQFDLIIPGEKASKVSSQ